MVMKNVTKNIQKIPFLFFLMLLTCFSAVAQNGITVKGVVLDGNGDSVIGASVVLKSDATVGTITDIDGNFQLAVPDRNSVIVISYIGMKTKEVKASTSLIKVTLEDDSQLLEEVVVVGFGQQKKESVVGAIAQASGEKLERTGGVTSLGQALSGNLPGVITMQTSGQPGAEDPQIQIRGVTSWNNSEPLVLVDGIERPMSSVDINSVATISVLKDASATAVFGVRGANGVILITTKRGEEGKAQIQVNANATLKFYSKLPDMMDAYDALHMRNEVIERELAWAPEYFSSHYKTQDFIHKYRYPANAEEAERYPNMNWADYLLKNVATSYNANVSVSGGTKFVRYYANVDYSHEGDIYKRIASTRGYDPGYAYDRFNVRSNLDFTLTKTTKLSVNLSGSHAVTKSPGGQYPNLVWAAFYGTAPDSFLPIYSSGHFGYYQPKPTQSSQNSAEYLYANGISYSTNDRLNTDFTLQQDLGFLLKGLRAHVRLAFDNSFGEGGRGVDDTNDWENENYKWIDPDTGQVYYSEFQSGLNKLDYYNTRSWGTSAGGTGGAYRRTNYSAQIDYSNTFGQHTVGAMGNFSREQYANGSQQPFFRENWVFRATYDYAKRYMLEYNGAYNGSEKFADANRFGFFNSGAVGWMLSEEPLFKKLNAKWVDMLKFRASLGQIGDDNAGRWLYMDTWSSGGSFRHGLTGINGSNSPYTWWYQSALGNPNVKWEIATKLDLAVDFSFLGGLFAGSFDYFHEKRSDILLDGGRRAIPDYFGATAPTANLGEIESQGYEFELRWNKVLGDWRIWGNASLTHAESEVIEADEPMLKPAYQKEAGKAINQTYSYVDKGYYNNWDELYGSTAHDTNDQFRLPGNYIILDYDADGVITQNDQVPYGYTGIPQNSMNAQFGVDWKGWSFFVQFYGVNNVTRFVNLASFEEFRNISYYEGSYWDKYNTNADVPMPRWGALQNSYTQGTRYLFDGSYLRLKYAELAYTFNSKSWIKKLGMNSLRLYVNGNNLFLWSSMPDDRESNTGGGSAYPTQRRVNVGFRLTL